jgi:hypothetical protein
MPSHNPIVESTVITVEPTSISSTTKVFGVGTKVPSILPFGFKLFEYPEKICNL